MIGLTHDEVKALNPCGDSFKRVSKLLGGAKGWNVNKIDADKAREAGCTFDDIVWAASALAKTDKDVERRLRLWMADCAARVLHIYEKTESSDAPRRAIIAARQFARGEIDAAARGAAWDAARAAARDAARAAAWDAARAAARDAARAAAWDAARGAAWDAARGAAWDAARAAARDAARAAAWDAARAAAWDAARAAARAAARDAARAAAWAAARGAARAAARDAAWDAAWGAARGAAGDAAWDAEESWQFDRLIARLSDDEPQDWPLPEAVHREPA